MRLTIFTLSLLFLVVVHHAAGAMKVIELTDGSRITGEVSSVNKGIYTIRSDSLGTVTIEESKIRAVRSKSSGINDVSVQETRALQEKMLSDEEIMALIESLRHDPDFKKALEDPEIMKAAMREISPHLPQTPGSWNY